jgi:serine/threonine-protein kinase
MGDVIFCTDQHLSRRVAIKFLKIDGEKKRLLDELRALQQLRSKHVVQLYDVVDGESRGIGLVQEFLAGEDLWESSAPRSSEFNYLRTVWQIACGLADIHDAGLIHRDIKPNNIKTDAEGIVKIFDFGLARIDGVDAQTVGFVGTFGFAAPELSKDDSVVFTSAVDVYAFGATAAFLAHGALPNCVAGNALTPTLRADLKTAAPLIPDFLLDLILRCLSHDPKSRPDMHSIRNTLRAHLLRDRHQLLVIYGSNASRLNATSRSVKLSLPHAGHIEIYYDGLAFRVVSVDGPIYLNNTPITPGQLVPDSCVLTMGAAGGARVFVTFDISHPEVTL